MLPDHGDADGGDDDDDDADRGTTTITTTMTTMMMALMRLVLFLLLPRELSNAPVDRDRIVPRAADGRAPRESVQRARGYAPEAARLRLLGRDCDPEPPAHPSPISRTAAADASDDRMLSHIGRPP